MMESAEPAGWSAPLPPEPIIHTQRRTHADTHKHAQQELKMTDYFAVLFACFLGLLAMHIFNVLFMIIIVVVIIISFSVITISSLHTPSFSFNS